MEENNDWTPAADKQGARKFTRFRIPLLRFFQVIAIALSVLVIGQTLWQNWHRNTLDFSDSTLTSVPVALVNANDTLYGTKSIVPIRKKQLADYPALFNQAFYKPSSFLFALVHEDAPWRSLKSELYRYLGPQDGTPAEGLSLLNPLLLIYPKFYSKSFSTQEAPKEGQTMEQIGKVISLVYNPHEKSVTLTCNVSEPLERRFGKDLEALNLLNFTLATYNALDLGYRKGMVLDSSINVEPNTTELEGLFTFIGYSKSGCGPEVGCNTFKTGPFKFNNFKMTNFPAKLVMGLWKSQNVDLKEQKPDLTYVIELQ